MLGVIRHNGFIPWDDDIDLGICLDDVKNIVSLLSEKLSDQYVVQCFDTDVNYAVTQPIIKVRKKNTNVEYDAWYDKNLCSENGIFIDLIAYSKIPESKFVNLRYRLISFISTLLLLILNYLKLNIKFLKSAHLNRALKFNNLGNKSNKFGYAINFISWKNIQYEFCDFFPLVEGSFNGISLKCPNNYDNILSKLYGDYMKIPDVQNIKFYHSKNLKLKGGKL